MVKKYFGTDGIRGKFNEELTVVLATKVGIAASKVLGEGTYICIGMDTRDSSKAIENALVSGLIAGGVNVSLLGYITTPVISKTIIDGEKYSAGIMISASHNPFYDNGIKFFGRDGKKLSDNLEYKMEDKLIHDINLECEIMGSIETDFSAKSRYVDYLVSIGNNLKGLNIALDCANGGGYEIAPEVFKKLGANISVIGNNPDGKNINASIGSTYPKQLSNLVKNEGLDFGFSFDGDGDRIMLIDSNGDVLDGDYILYILAKYLKNNNKLENNACVGTVMANLGFKKALESINVEFFETAVGDRFVMQEMTKSKISLGGEQSGHVIMSDLLPTGDGILTAVVLSKIFSDDINSLINIKKEVNKFPQVLENLVVEDKALILENPQVNKVIEYQQLQLNGEGRILVRASGTEQLIRVMVEAKEIKQCQKICDKIIMKMKQI